MFTSIIQETDLNAQLRNCDGTKMEVAVLKHTRFIHVLEILVQSL